MVLKSPEVNIGASRPRPQNFQEIRRQGRHQHLVLDPLIGWVFEGGFIAVEGRPRLVLDDVLHDEPPRSLRKVRIGRRQISQPDLTVDMGLFDRLIFVPDDSFGLLAVGGAEAGAGTRDGVHAVAHAATVGALDDPVSHFHTI